MATAVPPVATIFTVASVIMTTVTLATGSTFLQLVPGQTVLGSHHVHNVVTCFFTESSMARLVLASASLMALGFRAEKAHSASRVAVVVLVAAIVTGLGRSFAGLMVYLASSGDKIAEAALYKPQSGMTGLVGAYAVLAWQAAGEAPLFQEIPWLQTPLLVTVVVATCAWLQFIAGAGTDFILCVGCTFLTWAQLRFILPVSPGGPAGDARDSFELLHCLPPPLRTPLRPLEKLGSAICLPVGRAFAGTLPLYAALRAADGVSGGSFASLPAVGGVAQGTAMFRGSSGTSPLAGSSTPQSSRTAADGGRIDIQIAGGSQQQSGTGIYVSDPVAERRREKALKSLDKRLSELRNKMKGTGAVPVAAGAGAMASP